MRRRSQHSDTRPVAAGACLTDSNCPDSNNQANNNQPDISGLASLRQRATSLARLQQALWPALPTQLQAHCQLANVRNGSLIITADSPLWAAQARHLSRTLINRAKQLKLDLQRIEVRVVPIGRQVSGKLPSKQTPRQFSTAARQHVDHAASSTNDAELRAILRRIASRKPTDR